MISLTNDDVFVAGNLNNSATVILNSDDVAQNEGETTVGQGVDDVDIFNFVLGASTSSNMQIRLQKGNDVLDIHNIEVGGIGILAGGGNDQVTILNSDWGTGTSTWSPATTC